ncbi:MAG: hypothetical protein V7607_2549 [Solirubrobacteraceae bacterium]
MPVALRAADSLASNCSEQARRYILDEAPETFRFTEATAALPGISAATVRQVLNALRDEGKLSADRGPKAQWRRISTAPATDGRADVDPDGQ